MILRQTSMLFWITLSWVIGLASASPDAVDTISLKHIANISYAAENDDLSSLASIFSPRMDFDQWKPLTGRGDPLRNDPTYDYEPPVLERVHYWAEDARLEPEHYPERKSEVLMLGVSSRRPSVAPRPPPARRQQRPSVPHKYEDYTYKLNEHYPMTILVPPPPPPPGYQPTLYVLNENKAPLTNSPVKITNPPTFLPKRPTTAVPNSLTSLYALQESNLIYQSSTTSQNWLLNDTKTIPSVAVSSDYAGWGPTAPVDQIDVVNDTHNLIHTDQNEILKHPYSFYKPMLSEAPPPPLSTTSSIFLPTFIPTALPPTETLLTSTLSVTHATPTIGIITTEAETNSVQNYSDETTTEEVIYQNLKKETATHLETSKPDKNIFDMLGPMLSMPLINGPDRPEDHLYAHASENLHVYKEHPTENIANLETMQTMQPPPPVPHTESTTISDPYHSSVHINKFKNNKKASTFTHDPYLHMRFTTLKPIKIETSDDVRATSEEPVIPMYLIIQGHSKVKTYSSKPNLKDDHATISNEIVIPNETNEVKHLHPLQENKNDETNKSNLRESRSKNLKSLIENNYGSIEIQEADVGIKYDVSDGSEVPVEIYRKGIVDSNENSYTSKTQFKQKRTKRQLDLEDLLPFDEDTIEEFVYNFLNGKRNSTGITGLIAQAVTSDAASVVDDLEEEDNNNEQEEER